MKILSAVVALAALHACALAHQHADGGACRHDDDAAYQRAERRARGLHPDVYKNLDPNRHPPHPRDARSLYAQQWRPLRIQLYFDDVAALSAAEQEHFKTRIMQPAVDILENLIMVRQRTDDSALYLPQTCTSQRAFNGRFVCSQFASGNATCGGVTIPESFKGDGQIYNGREMETFKGGPGIKDADFLLVVVSQNVGLCLGSGKAYASTCMRDDIDRPIAGRYNQCPGSFSTSEDRIDDLVMTAVHEAIHALVFASDSFELFRDPASLEPLFPTDIRGDRETFMDKNFDDQLKFPTSMIEFSSERGQSGCNSIEDAGRIGKEKCTQRFVLPAIKEKARDYFGCNLINGPELENQATSAGFISSHWEQRSTNADVMSPISMGVKFITPYTLAVFEASGWYQVHYDRLEFNPGREWGHLAGCDLHLKRPIYPADPAKPYENLQVVRTSSTYRNNEQFYCAVNDGRKLCTPDLRAVGRCRFSTSDTAVSDQYRYFQDNTVKGTVTTMDFAPHIEYRDFCNRGPSNDALRSGVWEEIGAYFGKQHESACFVTSLRHDKHFATSPAGCYRYECDRTDVNNPVLKVKVMNDDGTGVQGEVSCAKGEGGDTKTVTGMTGSITCTEPEVLCGQAGTIPSPSPSTTPSTTPAASLPSPSSDTELPGDGGGKIPASPSPSPSPSSSPAAAYEGGTGPDESPSEAPAQSPAAASPSTSPSSGASPSPSTSMAPVAIELEELAQDYCPGTADSHASGDYPSVAGARVSLAGLGDPLTCDSAPDMQAACARVLDVEAHRVAVKVPGAAGASRRRLQGLGTQEVTVAVAADSAEEAQQMATALVTSVSTGTLVTELAVENQAVFAGATATVPATSGTFSGSLPPPEQPDSGGSDDRNQVDPAIAYGSLAGLVVILGAVVGVWLVRRRSGASSAQGKADKGEFDSVAAAGKGAGVPDKDSAKASASSKESGAAAAQAV